MIYTSTILAEASGSVGGLTFSRNAGGSYTRRRAVPTNPNSPFQQSVRSYMALLAQGWANLASQYRFVWNIAGKEIGTVNALGQTKAISGLAFYCKQNVPRLQAGKTRWDNPQQADITPIDIGEPTIAVDSATGLCTITFDDTKPWATDATASILVYISRGYRETINYFNGPYRYAGKIDGVDPGGVASPQTIALPVSVITGDKVFVRLIGCADERLNTSPFRASGIST